MPNIWEDFAWSTSKRLRIRTHHKCHIIFQEEWILEDPPFPCPSPLPPANWVSAASSDFYINSVVLLNPALSNPILVSVPDIYNSQTPLPLCLSLSRSSSLLYHSALLQTFPLIPSHSPSPPLSPPLIFILPSHTCPLPPPHIHTHHFLSTLTCYPVALLSSHPVSFRSSLPSLPPTRHPPLFLLPSSHLILTCWLFFTPVCSSLLFSLPSKPIIDSRGCAAHH